MTDFDPKKITFFAKTDARGQGTPFGIRAIDRQRHMYVIGKTGMGKSTMLENMAIQDIQNGEGLAFIDPHGSTADTIMEYIPEHRVKDVVYFAPFDLENPISFNVMEDVGPEKRHLVVSGLMSTFKKIWVDAWSARMEYILTNALLVLIEYPDTTLLSVNRLFSDKAYRKQVVEACQDPAVKAFWVDEFAGYTERFTAEALPAIQNKIGQFTGNPLIRNIIGQPHSSFDFRELMDQKKIIIMNLSKGLIGETNANLLGSMLTTRIYLAAMSRADLPVEQMQKMPNFYFYVDEFQSFANATFANILSEARKYHLNLIIAHQYIEQMEEDVRNAVFGNVGTTIAFRVGPFDAEVLETVFAPRFEAVDLVNLGSRQIYLTLMIDGIGSQPFSAETLNKPQAPQVSYKGVAIENSRKVYGGARADVEKVVADLHTPVAPPPRQDNKKPYEPKKFDNNRGQAPSNKGQDSRRTDTKPLANNQSRQSEGRTVYNYQPRQFDNKPRENTERPKLVEKTPDDLRQILSKMTTGEKTEDTKATPKENFTKKDWTPNKPRENQNNVKSRTEKENNPRSETRLNQPNIQPDPKPMDLRQALADVIEKTETGSENRQQAITPKPTPAHQQAAKPATPPLPDPAPLSTPEYTPSANSAPTPYREEEVDSSGSIKITDRPSLDTTAQVQKIMAEYSPYRPANSIPSSVSNGESNTIDINEVKKILRQADNERSPFN